MKVIKRNGSEVDFDIRKIVAAVAKANKAAIREELTEEQIEEIADYINFKCSKMNRAISVEEMQDMVENQIMAQGAFNVARCNVIMKRFCRRIPIRIRSSTVCSVIIWQER